MLRVGGARQPWMVVHLGEGNSDFKPGGGSSALDGNRIVVVPRPNQLVTQDVNCVDDTASCGR